MQRGLHLHKWNFSSSKIMAEISSVSPFPIYQDMQQWVMVIVCEYFIRTGKSCLGSYNILYSFLGCLIQPAKKSPDKTREWFCLALCPVLECWHWHFAVLQALRLLKRLSLYHNQLDEPLCYKPILNSQLAANASIYMATDLMNKKGENIHYITNYISWPTHYSQINI